MALRGTLTHWKTRTLAAELSIQPCFALGLLEALWHTTAELAPAGNIGRLPNRAIAMEMFYEGDADKLIEALIISGHVDKNEQHRLVIHDWLQHADYNTKRKVERRGESMVGHDASSPVITPHKSIPVPEPVPEPVVVPVPEPAKEQTTTFPDAAVADAGESVTKAEIKTFLPSVFAFYCEQVGRDPKRYTLTPGREAKALSRIAERLKLHKGNLQAVKGELATAIRNLAESAYHREKGFLDWNEQIFRSQEEFEKRLNWQKPKGEKPAITAGNPHGITYSEMTEY